MTDTVFAHKMRTTYKQNKEFQRACNTFLHGDLLDYLTCGSLLEGRLKFNGDTLAGCPVIVTAVDDTNRAASVTLLEDRGRYRIGHKMSVNINDVIINEK